MVLVAVLLVKVVVAVFGADFKRTLDGDTTWDQVKPNF